MAPRKIHAAAVAALMLAATAACGSDDAETTATSGAPSTTAAPNSTTEAPPSTTTAPVATNAKGDLRVGLNALLESHTIYASMATGAALDGRTEDFEAAAALLDTNSRSIADALASVYGSDPDAAYELWNEHIGYFVDYATALAGDDQAAAGEAQANLDEYATTLATFINEAVPGLPIEAVEGLVVEHVGTLSAVIDAQASGDAAAATTALGEAVGHMAMIADPLAGAIAEQAGNGMSGQVDDAETDLRVALGSLLRQHTAYASLATGAALDGRTEDFEASVALLDTNSRTIAETLAGVYSSDPDDAYELWNEHIGYFVDYTTALAGDDQAAADEAQANLDEYAGTFATFITSVLTELPTEAVEGLVRDHVATLSGVIDAQASDDPDAAFTALGEAMDHMPMIADPLAAEIAALG